MVDRDLETINGINIHGDAGPVNPASASRVEGGEQGAVEFVRERLGMEPDERQAAVLRSKAKRGILLCTRQWGKSTITAAMAVQRAFTRAGSLVLVASPTDRQSGEFIRKASEMARRLSRELMDVRMTRRENGRARIGADGAGEHDDLAMALSLAVWRARRGGGVVKRSLYGTQRLF